MPATCEVVRVLMVDDWLTDLVDGRLHQPFSVEDIKKIYVILTFQTLNKFFFQNFFSSKFQNCTCFFFPWPPLWTLFPLPSSHQSLCRIWQLKQMKLTKKTRLQSQSSNSTQPKISSVVTE